MQWKRFGLYVAGAAILASSAAGAYALRYERQEKALVEDLRQGGYVLYLRHADRFKGERETLGLGSPLSAFDDCSQQRNLTPYGEAEAMLLGETFRRWDVGFDRIIANPLCRTRQTAMLVFGRTETDIRLYDPRFVRTMLAIPPRAGLNTVLVGSESQLRDIIGVQIEPAEVAVFQPNGKGGFSLVGRLAPDEWLSD